MQFLECATTWDLFCKGTSQASEFECREAQATKIIITYLSKASVQPLMIHRGWYQDRYVIHGVDLVNLSDWYSW